MALVFTFNKMTYYKADAESFERHYHQSQDLGKLSLEGWQRLEDAVRSTVNRQDRRDIGTEVNRLYQESIRTK